jgi:anti-sigma B factor antagonist
MAIDVRASESNSEVKIAVLSGRLDMETAEADSPALLESLEGSPQGIVIDMEGVDFLSSSGLRMLLSAFQKARETGKKMPLIRVQPLVYKIFKVSALDGMFSFFESEAEAIEMFQA